MPSNANIVNSNVLYKMKYNDDKSLKLKAGIAPHGNKDDLKDVLTKDCTTCPPTGIRIIESIVTLNGWTIALGDLKTAFLKTGEAKRSVFVKPPPESKIRCTHLWELLVAAYGLVNSGAKWQYQSDKALLQLGLTQSKNVPQLFYKKENGKLVLLLVKVVDDIMVTEADNLTEMLLKDFNSIFKLGTLKVGP